MADMPDTPPATPLRLRRPDPAGRLDFVQGFFTAPSMFLAAMSLICTVWILWIVCFESSDLSTITSRALVLPVPERHTLVLNFLFFTTNGAILTIWYYIIHPAITAHAAARYQELVNAPLQVNVPTTLRKTVFYWGFLASVPVCCCFIYTHDVAALLIDISEDLRVPEYLPTSIFMSLITCHFIQLLFILRGSIYILNVRMNAGQAAALHTVNGQNAGAAGAEIVPVEVAARVPLPRTPFHPPGTGASSAVNI